MEPARAWVEERIGARVAALEPLPGGAGARRYLRVRSASGACAVLMQARPEDPAIAPPALAGRDALAEFVTATRFLAHHELPVPEILSVEPERRWVLLEDLGEVHLCDLPASERRPRTLEALELLARVHALEPPDALPFRRAFDGAWARFELAHFLEHAVPAARQHTLERELAELARAIEQLPRVLALRDYQSQNLMIDPRGRLRMLDYQDAFRAPAALDLVALLWDSYVEIDAEERRTALEHYARRAPSAPPPGSLELLVVQRKCKDLGRFLYVCRVKGDMRYEPAAERARQAVLAALPALPAGLGSLGAALERVLREAP
jgi:aminoglycoside/choline kinase family phosphotransferase